MESKQQYNGKEIAVVGMACRFPGAGNVKEFWQNLKNGVESIELLTPEQLEAAGVDRSTYEQENYVRSCAAPQDIDLFDAGFFNFNPREAELLDPQHRLFLECAWETIENAGYCPSNYEGLIGVFAGSGASSYLFNNIFPSADLQNSVGTFEMVMSNDKDFLPSRVSYKLDLKGPSINVQTACSTSLVAIHMACRSLLQGECDMAIAGGVSVRIPQKAGYLYQEGMILSRDGHCRAFDKEASGIIDGSGVGIVMLKPLADALEDGDVIHAVIRGSSVNNDGAAKVGYTAPSIEGQEAVIRETLDVAGVEPSTIQYVEAHGTGTKLGDPIEIRALRQAYLAAANGPVHCALGSVKTNIGHLDAAAGVAGFIKSVLALKEKQIPASLNYTEPNPAIDFGKGEFYINDRLRDWPAGPSPRRAAVSSFGIGGTNVHLILEEAPEVPAVPFQEESVLLLLSARSQHALETATANLTSVLQAAEKTNLSDITYTLQTGREAFRYKRALYCRSHQDALQILQSRDPKRVWEGVSDMGKKEVVFLFSGQGSQYVNMGRELYETETLFRETVDECAEILLPLIGFRLTDVIFPEGIDPAAAEERLKQTALAQPALFTISYALAKLWISRGVIPAAMAGHSVGEYVAACLSGVFTLEQALGLIALRGKLMQSMPIGKMLAVSLPESEVQRFLSADIELATINGPSACVLSGPVDPIDALAATLDGLEIRNIALQTSHAFHSRMMEGALPEFEAEVAKMDLNPPAVPFLSNLSGTWITPKEATSPSYWAAHLRHTVRFHDNLALLLQNESYIPLEVGPGKTLASLCQQQASGRLVLHSLPHPKEKKAADQAFAEATAALWLAGLRIDWASMHEDAGRRKVELPSYPFERQSYWIEPSAPQRQAVAAPIKNPDMSAWFYLPSWQRSGRSFSPDPVEMRGSLWVVFLNDHDLFRDITAQILSAGAAIVLVREGSRFEQLEKDSFCIRPSNEEDYEALFREISKSPLLLHILQGWNLSVPGQHAGENTEMHLELGLYSLLEIAKATSKYCAAKEVRLSVIADQMHEVMGDEPLEPAKAAIGGACKVISLEYPNIRCRQVDLSPDKYPSASKERLEAQLLGELCSESVELLVAYRGNFRWLPTYEQVSIPAPAEAMGKLKEKGVYLITGGFGGMGYTIAAELARRYRARLILVGRSPIPPRAAWRQWLAEKGTDDATSRRIMQVQELELHGAEVLAYAADVSDFDAMDQVVRDSRAAFGNIDGVFHFAGLADYAGIIQRRSKEDTQRVLDPKIKGTLVLKSVLQANPLDFMLLASTIGSVLYHSKFGQVGYCAANDFLDLFALAETRAAKTHVQVINWNDWDDVGMTVEAAEKWAMRGQGSTGWKSVKLNGVSVFDDALSPQEGTQVVLRTLQSDYTRVIVCTRDLDEAMALDRKNNFTGFMDIKVERAASLHERPQLSNSYVEASTETETALTQIWQRLLGLDQVGIHDDFFELGGHSLIGIQITSEINRHFGLNLQIGILFEHPSIKELAEHLDNFLWARSNRHETLAPVTTFEEEGEI